MDVAIEDFEKFLRFRQKYDAEVVAQNLDSRRVRLCMAYQNAGWLFCDVENTNPRYMALAHTFNEPFDISTRRIFSHDFGNSATWADPANSLYSIAAQSIQHPVFGPLNARLSVYTIFVRFPKNATFGTNNHAWFKYYKSLDGVTPVDVNTPPIINYEFPTLTDLLVESEGEIEMTADVIDGVYTTSMVQAMFDFSPAGKRIILRQSLNERLDVYFGGHVPVADPNGDPLTDPCHIVIISNETIEF